MPSPDLARALNKALMAEPPAVHLAAGGPFAAARPPETAERSVVVLGVGSEMRQDDAAGVHVAAALSRAPIPGVHAIDGGSAPENCTAEIRQLNPSHILIIDSAHMGEPPGRIRLIDSQDIGGSSFGTHGLPLSVLADYLASEIGCRVTIIGIQPASVDFGEGLSSEVRQAVEEIVLALRACRDIPSHP